MELYYEQNVTNHNIDERAKKTKTLIIARTIFGMIGLFILISSAVLITMFWAFLLMSLPFFGVTIILGIINKRNNTEYDYVLDDEYFKISEIYYRQRRKLKYAIQLRAIESVGVFDSEGYRKIERNAIKKNLALVNYDDEDSIIYILYYTQKGRKIIFIEPDRGFMIALRRVVSALTVFDKSIADFEKRLTAKEEAEAEDRMYSEEDDENENTDEDDNNNLNEEQTVNEEEISQE
ncbi:MAG: hypothetical protein J1G01_02450 [Clostridiales bacterium]|nr:hypothetical protein [Clostridiales bacterium]